MTETCTVEEAAKSLKVDSYTIRRFCREKKIPAFKFAGNGDSRNQRFKLELRRTRI